MPDVTAGLTACTLADLEALEPPRQDPPRRRGVPRRRRPLGHPRAFDAPPLAIVEVLSDDDHHDLVRKDEIYAQRDVRRACVDMKRRFDWWLRLDGVNHAEPFASWELEGWPALRFDREALFAADG
jgi:hypothetical protein